MRILTFVIVSVSLFTVVACQPSKPYQSRAKEVFPPVALRYAALSRIDELPVTPAFFNDRWTALAFVSLPCEDECQRRLALLDAVSQAQTLVVIENVASHTRLRALKQEYPSLAISMGTTAASIDNFMQQFENEWVSPENRVKAIYLVNPAFEFSYLLSAQGLESGQIDKELMLLKTAFNKEREI